MSRLTKDELNRFTGSTSLFRHTFGRVTYTEGVQHLAEAGGAYWLVDAIASHLTSRAFNEAAQADPRVRLMHFWHLAVREDDSATLTAVPDGGEPAFVTQEIEWTDFPLDSADVWAAANELGGFTLMLPGEY